MNKAESESLVIQLQDSGWTVALSLEDSDAIIINTCSVRNTAEERIWGRIGFFRREKKKKPFKLVITGCMAERLKEQLIKKAPEVDAVIGNFSKHRFAEYLDYIIDRDEKKVFAENGEYFFQPKHNKKSFKAFIPVMHGCDNFCSYCIVPYVRGREISRRPEEISNEISSYLANGIKEITLLGQNVNSYKFSDNGRFIHFKELLASVSNQVGSNSWIRFLTSHPKDLDPALIEIISSSNNICKHIHLPVQHASDSILGKMNRKYTISYVRDLIRNMRKNIPDISITTDLLLGFPGETEEDYNQTLFFLEEIQFDDAFMYRYNPREGTAAFSMKDDVSEESKFRRLDAVIRLQRRISSDKKKKKIGRKVPALIECVSKKNGNDLLARTEQDEMVVFPGSMEKIGTFALVELIGLNGNTFTGKETT
jgi:tRNA-2-methylthio-N6-dimethylallyladenosine synthase